MYVPARITELLEVVVAANVIAHGELLDESNTMTKMVDKHTIRTAVFSSADQVVGARSKRQIRPGQVVQLRNVCIVCKGDRVSIVAKVGNLSVKSIGLAQQDGRRGDTISVKNSRSKKVIQARVNNVGSVAINI